jgi:serine/threonine protein kinase
MVYAVKRMNKRVIKQRRAERLILEERAVLEHSKSRFVTDLKFAFQTADEVCLGLELIGGGDLDQLLAKRGKLSEEATKLLATEMVAAIHDLHSKGIMHRDIKPANVLLTPDGHVKLADLGLACFVGNGTMARTIRKAAQAAAQAAAAAEAVSAAACAPGNASSEYEPGTVAGSSTSPSRSAGSNSSSDRSMGSARSGRATSPPGILAVAAAQAAAGAGSKPSARLVIDASAVDMSGTDSILRGADGTQYEQLKHGFVRVDGQYNVRPYARGRAGTPGFWAPEMLIRDVHSSKPGKYDGTADWWSFGCMLYALMTGRSPFSIRHGDTNDDNFATLHAGPALDTSQLSPDLADLLARLLDKNPSTRLGRNGSSDVMSHPWFRDVVWQDVFHGHSHRHSWAQGGPAPLASWPMAGSTAGGSIGSPTDAAGAAQVSPNRQGARLPPICTTDAGSASPSWTQKPSSGRGDAAGTRASADKKRPVDEIAAGFRLRLRHDQHPKDAKRLQDASTVIIHAEDSKLYTSFEFEQPHLYMRDVVANFGLVSFRESVNMAKAVRDGVVLPAGAEQAQGLEVLQHALLSEPEKATTAPADMAHLSYGTLLYAMGEFQLASSVTKAAQRATSPGEAGLQHTVHAAARSASTEVPKLVTLVSPIGDDHRGTRARLPWKSNSWQREAELGIAMTRLGSLTTNVFPRAQPILGSGAYRPGEESRNLQPAGFGDPGEAVETYSAASGIQVILNAANECLECADFLRKSCDSLGRMIDSHGQHSLSAQLHGLAQAYKTLKAHAAAADDGAGTAAAADSGSDTKQSARRRPDAGCEVM